MPQQSVHVSGGVTETKPPVKRNQKTGKKPGMKSGKESSKKNLNSTGKSAFYNNKKIKILLYNVLN